MADGGRYDGEWRNGDRNGRGVLIYSDGCRYDGEWKDDKPCYQWLQPVAIGFVIVCMLIYWLRRSTAPPANDNVARLADALRRVADAHASRRVATDDQINQLPIQTMTQTAQQETAQAPSGAAQREIARAPPANETTKTSPDNEDGEAIQTPPENDNTEQLFNLLTREAAAAAVPSRRVAANDQIDQLPCHIITQTEIINAGLSGNEGSSDSSDANHAPYCIICREPYEVGDELRTLRCFHKFHKDCIDQWLRTPTVRPVCPLCKTAAV